MNIALEISYIGTNYSGYQIQPNKLTVQGELEKAIEKAFGEKITTIASGRTDAGVSALCQVVNFKVETLVPAEKIMYVINENLPNDIRVMRSYLVDDDFNARFNAKRKTYEYRFYVADAENAIYSEHSLFVKGKLDIESMKEACKFLIGEYDFSSFCASDTEVTNKVRTIYHADIVSTDFGYKLIICGNGFLYNMVRIIMGTLLEVGYKKLKSSDILSIIKAKDRSKAGHTVASTGLMLLNVEY